jgi:hypothetical protein
MNAAGIPVLYAALDVETAAAEVYDGKGSVAIASLRPRRSLTIVDLTAIPHASPLDPLVPIATSQRAAFLRSFTAEITRPIIRDGRIHHEYTPTQIFTEYIQWRLLPPQVGVDGIVYPSARTDGRNIVIFAGPAGCLPDGGLPPSVNREAGEEQLLEADSRVAIRTYKPPASLPQGSREIG